MPAALRSPAPGPAYDADGVSLLAAQALERRLRPDPVVGFDARRKRIERGTNAVGRVALLESAQ